MDETAACAVQKNAFSKGTHTVVSASYRNAGGLIAQGHSWNLAGLRGIHTLSRTRQVQQDKMDHSATDLAMMERCIRLSATARKQGELPFACVICDGDRVVAEATNRVRQDGDVTRHAELVAISAAQKALGKKNLSRCTLYSTIEPCPMCSFPIRETRMRRVVYAIDSPTMGGVSKWNVLRDTEISNVMPEAFGPVPEVISGLLAREAEMVWWKSHPIIWGIIKQRGCFGPARASGGLDRMRAIRPPLGWFRSLLMLHNN